MRSRALLIYFLIGLVAIGLLGPKAQLQGLSDSSAEKRVDAYIRAFNSHDEKAFANFIEENMSPGALKSRSMDERLKVYRQLYADLGELRLKKLTLEDNHQMSTLVQSTNGSSVEMTFQFEPNEPHKIISIRVDLGQVTGPPTSQRIEKATDQPRAGDAAASSSAKAIDPKILASRVEDYLAGVEGFGFTGTVLVAKDGQVLAKRGIGEANRERHLPFTRDTVFDIGSNAKDFTKMSILQLIEKGKLKFDDSLSKFFQQVPDDKSAITVEQLMRHTAGLVENIGDDRERITRDEMERRVFASKLISTPGQEFNYSNAGYSMLAAIIEIVSGQTYDEYVNEHILKSAGMTRTGYALVAWRPDEIANSYVNGENAGSTFDYPHFRDGASWTLRGNGGMLSTLDDMYRFHLALAAETLLSAKSKSQLFPQDRPLMLVGGNGIHFFVYRRDPQNGIAIIAASTDADMKATDLSERIAGVLRGDENSTPPRVLKLGAPEVTRRAGIYHLTTGGDLEITENAGRLMLMGVGQEAFAAIAGKATGADPSLNKINEKTASIVAASVHGDYSPWADAYGGQVPLEQIRERQENLWQQRKQRLGAFKDFRVMGTLANPGRGSGPGNGPAPNVTTVRLNFEHGPVFVQYLWNQAASLAGVRQLTAPGVAIFFPKSGTEFVSYDLSSGQTTSLAFKTDGSTDVLSLTTNRGQVVSASRTH